MRSYAPVALSFCPNPCVPVPARQLCPARPPFPSWAQRAAAAALATGSTAALATGPWDASMLSSAASTVQGMINPFMLFSATTPTKLQHQGPGGAVSGATGFGARRVEVEAVSPPAPLPPLPTLRSQLSSDLAAAAAAALEEGLCSPRLETVQSGDLAGGEVWVGHSGPVPLQKQGSGMAQFALQDMLIADTPHALETASASPVLGVPTAQRYTLGRSGSGAGSSTDGASSARSPPLAEAQHLQHRASSRLPSPTSMPRAGGHRAPRGPQLHFHETGY